MNLKQQETLYRSLLVVLAVTIVFAVLTLLGNNAYAFSINEYSNSRSVSIDSEEEKTKENLVRYYSKMLDGSFSDEFIDAVSEEATSGVYWKFFQENNTNPIRFLRTDNVHLPDTRGLQDVWRIDGYENIWINKDGIKYERNDFGSFKRITPIIVEKTCESKWQVMTRVHCDWDDMKELEQLKASAYLKSHHYKLFDEPFDKINNIFAYDFPEIDHRTQFLINKGMYDWARLGGEQTNGVAP